MNKDKNDYLDSYFNLMAMNGAIYIYHYGRKKKLFKKIGERHLSTKEISKLIKGKEYPVSLLLDIYVQVGLFSKSRNNKYSITPLSRFLQDQYRDLGKLYWKYLPLFLKTGKPLAKMDIGKKSERKYSKQVEALHWMMKPSAEEAARLINKKRKKLKILDVGAGSGVWSLEILKKNKGSRTTLFDFPLVIESSKKIVSESKLEGRVDYLAGDYDTYDIKDRYNLIILGNITHLETSKGNIILFKKLRKNLEINGELVIFDVFSGQEKGEIIKAIYELGLAMRTRDSRIYTKKELIDFLKSAGFSKFEHRLIKVPPYIMGMIIAKI